MQKQVRVIESDDLEEGLLLSLLTYFTEDEWKPSLNLSEQEGFSNFPRREISRTLNALSNPRLMEKFRKEDDTVQTEMTLDARLLKVKGATSRATYQLSPIGRIMRDELLKKKDRS